jgi:hypothetical protein
MKRKLSKGLVLGKRSIAILSRNAMAGIDGGSVYTQTNDCHGTGGGGGGGSASAVYTGCPGSPTADCGGSSETVC